jgi:hypothetical protein
MNGILGAADRQPTPNWGFTPNTGYTTMPGAVTGLADATTLRFWARGKTGGEKIMFFCEGVGCSPDTGYQTANPFDTVARNAAYVYDSTVAAFIAKGDLARAQDRGCAG